MEGEKEKNGEHEKLIAFPPKNIETEQKTVRKRGPKKQVIQLILIEGVWSNKYLVSR